MPAVGGALSALQMIAQVMFSHWFYALMIVIGFMVALSEATR